jgi:hypothetical protein
MSEFNQKTDIQISSFIQTGNGVSSKLLIFSTILYDDKVGKTSK